MYILDQKQQIECIKRMSQIKRDARTWEVLYHDPVTGDMWQSFFPQLNGNICGPKLLRLHPLPTSLYQQMHLCLNSSEPSDARGLALEYSSKPELWIRILKLLKKHRKQFNKKSIKLFIHASGFTYASENFKHQRSPVSGAILSNNRLQIISKTARRLLFHVTFGL